MNDLTVLFVNYNKENADCSIALDLAIKSFEKRMPFDIYEFLIYENSPTDEYNFVNTIKERHYKNKVRMIKEQKWELGNTISISHMAAVDTALACVRTKYVLICDCDVYFKKDLSDILELRNHFNVAGYVCGDFQYEKIDARITPQLLLLDVEWYNNNGLRFANFDAHKNAREAGCKFLQDSGGSFLIEILRSENVRFYSFFIYDYVEHYGCVSYKNNARRAAYSKYFLNTSTVIDWYKKQEEIYERT